MARKVYVFKEGKFIEVGGEVPQPVTPFVQPDEIAPIKHPVNGKLYTSKREYEKDTRRMGYEFVDNTTDMTRHEVKGRLTEERILDGIERAEAIVSDPSKRRAYENLREQGFRNIESIINGKR